VVDEKFYLSKKFMDYVTTNDAKQREKGNGFRFSPTDGNSVAKAIRTGTNNKMDDNFVYDSEVKNNIMPVCLNSKGGRGGVEGLQPSVQDRVYDSEAISTAVTTSYMPSVAVRENTKSDDPVIIEDFYKSRDERVYKEYSPALRSDRTGLKVANDLRIRKLTPLECWRLMGFDDEDFYKAEKVCSNSQLYKQAGNSIVVDVLEYLFKEIMEVLEVKKVDDKVIVYECDSLINLEALKEKEPELYEELLADYPCESATYVFKVVS
jgi:DNA (cytosine-5)-methyltransferase 1